MKGDNMPITLINRNFRLSLLADYMLTKTAGKLGVTKTAVVEMAIRRMARAEGIFEPDEQELEKQHRESKDAV
jgi:hypothetical protein